MALYSLNKTKFELDLIDLIYLSTYLIIGLQLSFIDIKTYTLPHHYTLLLGLIGGSYVVIHHHVIPHILAALIGFTLFSIIKYLGTLHYKKPPLGDGDIIFITVIGLYWGIWPIILTIQSSFILGGIYAVFVLIIKKEVTHIPFGPFIFLGSLIGILNKFL